MRHILPAALLLASAASAVHAATPFEPADLYRISMVDAVATAPAGNQVLFSRASFDIQTDRRVTEWWLASINGSTVTQRLLIGAGSAARSPVWSPDGSRIAYVAPYLGRLQLWVMALADGVGQPITSGPLSPGAPAWSPDGKSIAFVARVEVPAPKVAGMPAKPEGAIWAPEPKLITDYSWRTNDGGYIRPGADQLFVVAASGGAARQLTSGSSDQISGAPRWAPDGQSLVYAAEVRPGNEALNNESDLYRISASGGTPTRLTDIDGGESQPKLSPDGRMIAWVGTPKTSKFYAQPGLWVRALASGTPVHITAALDRPVNSAEWAADGKSLLVHYSDVGLTRVAQFALAGGKPAMRVPEVGGTRLYLPSSGGDWSCAAATCGFTTVAADRPAGLGIIHAGKPLVVADFNAAWRAGKQIGALERLTWQAPDGLTIEGWLQFPPNFDPAKKYPVALDIHGGPNTDYGPYFSITHQIYAAAGYVVLFANPRSSIGYGERFANGISPEYGGEYPGPDHDDLMAGMDAVLKRPWADARNQFIGGGSGGGVMTTFAIGKTNRFKAAAALRPVTDWSIQALTSDLPALTTQNWVVGTPWADRDLYWRRSTFSLIGQVTTPTLLITGEADYRTPIAQTEAYYQALKIRGVPAMMLRLPEANHGMGRPSQWLQSNLAVVNWYEQFRVK